MKSRRLARAIVLIALYAVVCAVAGTFIADGTLHPAHRVLTQVEVIAFHGAMDAMKATASDVTVKAADGETLRGWMVIPQHPNGSAALVLHGLADNRLGMAGYALILLAHGYAVLLPD